MATRKKSEYKSLAIVRTMKATSRASVKVSTPNGDSFYTLEYCEERYIPENADVEKERKILWDVVNTECDNQIQDVLHVYRK